ncbi:MAG: N-6 DNA methylase [Acidobacteria bacterium]|nr:N-6 DNA methylase [Acidobacteriota bacterium]
MGPIELQEIEQRRLQQQTRLDSLRTAAERNRWGQFATPPELALSIARYARKLMCRAPVRFLDPAIGTGAFYSALAQVFPPEKIKGAAGIELDPLFAETTKTLWAGRGLKVVQGDFTRQRPPEQRFNLVLTNPPYVRHHHLAASEKDRLKAQLALSLYLDISGLAGLYCYFLLLCHDWMEDGGLAVWLIPSEFMDVNYGATIRRYLTERVTLQHIHRFCPEDVQFTDALVSSAIVVFRKSAPPPGHRARFSFAGSIEDPHTEALVPLDVLRDSRKWTHFPARTTVENTGELILGDVFAIKRGLATGANSFFILTEPDTKKWQIPRAFVKPILPGPKYLTEDIVEALPSGSPNVSPQLYLVDCNEPEEQIKTTWPRFYEYLQQGRSRNIHASYLASRRAPWYSQEQRPAAPFLCTYMGRSRNGKHPFRFIWNRSQATAHNVYLMLYPKGRLRAALKKHPELEVRVFEALQRITPAQFLSEGRVYGGGLHKVEPNELAQIPARLVLDAIETHVRIEQQVPLFT